MKNFKKFLTLVLAVMMVVSSVAFSTSAATTKFEDIDPKNEALVEAVDLLAYMGIAKGKSETNFGADELVTREQFALFMYRLMKGGKDAPAGASNSSKFTDLEDPTYFYAISWASANGIVNGKSATTFAPKDGIKLQEAYAMIVRALGWEKTNDLVYPFGHIEVAEQKHVALDNELDSSVGYADELTRGDMAILLYNAFFAEMGEEKTRNFVRILEDDEHGDYDEFFFIEEVYHPVLCEEVFGAINVQYQAIATPHYAVEGEEATYDLGYDAIYFEDLYYNSYIDGDEYVEVPAYTYIAAEDIRLEADELDNYFLGVFNMYVTVDDEFEIDKVLYADCDMDVKTVSDLTFGEVSSNKLESYYIDYAATAEAKAEAEEEGELSEEEIEAIRIKDAAKLLSGKITADGEDFYAYNAPYSYLKPSYNNCPTAYDKYVARNWDNVRAINFTLDDDAADDEVRVVLADTSAIVCYPEELDEDVEDKYFTHQAEELVNYFKTAYYGGLHEATLYDVDGDGRYEYINYAPYTFFQVDTDEDEVFEDSDFGFFTGEDLDDDHEFPYIYTTEAVVKADVDFAAEDYVIGYVSEELDIVRIAAVVKPTVDTLDSFRRAKGTITLGNGDVVDVTGSYKLLANMLPVDEAGDAYYGVAFDSDKYFDNAIKNFELFDNGAVEEEYEFYIYDGTLLYYGDVDNNFKYTENLIIPTDLYYEYSYEVEEEGELVTYEATTEDMILGNDDEITRYPEEAFDAEAGKVWYIYAWVDGKTRYVPVATEDVEPNLIVDEMIAPEYLNKLCTYSVDADGVYTIKSLGYDVDDDDDTIYEGVNKIGAEALSDDYLGAAALDNKKKDDLQLYVEAGEEAITIEKKAGTRFSIKTVEGETLECGECEYCADEEKCVLARDVDLKAYTKIVIRVFDVEEQEFTWSVYDASSFKKSLEEGVELTNVSYILGNNPDSKSRENLVVLYAETTDVSFKGETNKDNIRIVSDVRAADDEDGLWRFYYDVYNPYTGEKVYDVPSANAEKKSSMLDDDDAFERGDIIKLYDGMADEDKGNAVVTEDALVYITEVDEAEGFFAVAKYNDVAAGVECKECIDEAVESYEGEVVDFANTERNGDPKVITMGDDEVPTNFIRYNKNTVVTVLRRDYSFELINHWADGKMALTSMEAIADKEKDLLCYNEDAKDRNGKFKTGYADYVKAYVSVVDEKLDEDELPVADFVIVIVNGEEAAALDVDCADHE